MKLIQLNIWQGRILWQVAPFLKQHNPDIVCLQEIFSSPEGVPNWDSFSGLETLQQALPELQYWFFAPLYSYSVQRRKVTSGNAIGSRYPIVDKQVFFTHGQYVDEKDPTPNTRNAQSCKLSLSRNVQLGLVNHHAYWDKNPAGAPEAIAKMQQVCDAAMALGDPVIVTGDLNVVPQSKPMQVFKGKLENLTETHAVKTTLTQLARAFDRNNIVPCDHILVSPGVQVQNFYASETIVSDHKPLILEFDVPEYN